MNPIQVIANHCDRMARQECRRLEAQAMLFVKMGYAIEELIVIEHRDARERGVYPKDKNDGAT